MTVNLVISHHKIEINWTLIKIIFLKIPNIKMWEREGNGLYHNSEGRQAFSKLKSH